MQVASFLRKQLLWGRGPSVSLIGKSVRKFPARHLTFHAKRI